MCSDRDNAELVQWNFNLLDLETAFHSKQTNYNEYRQNIDRTI